MILRKRERVPIWTYCNVPKWHYGRIHVIIMEVNEEDVYQVEYADGDIKDYSTEEIVLILGQITFNKSNLFCLRRLLEALQSKEFLKTSEKLLSGR
jgi:hypothetical protein